MFMLQVHNRYLDYFYIYLNNCLIYVNIRYIIYFIMKLAEFLTYL